jgi:hypothetical protein
MLDINLNALNEKELEQLLEAVRKALYKKYPVANIFGDRIKCAHCGELIEPKLIEEGYDIEHELVNLSEDFIEARGWDGSSSDASESVYNTVLFMCPKCFQKHQLPDIDFDWV